MHTGMRINVLGYLLPLMDPKSDKVAIVKFRL